ncbi:MAG TPA: hypothetical protein VLC92_12760 [Rhodocyclaceae bacterium]|nr:hypothetical protein [Rhodocyclaceae bacterium]
MSMQQAQEVQSETTADKDVRISSSGTISRTIAHFVLMAVPVMLVIGIVVAVLPRH